MRTEANGSISTAGTDETRYRTPAGRAIRALRPVLEATSVRALGALLAGERDAEPPDWSARPHRILFVRYERIGDLIMATSLIRAIATSHASITLDVLASRANAAVLEGNPHVRRVLVLGRRTPAEYAGLLRRIRAIGYDAVVDGRINGPRVFLTTPLVMAAARARYRIGWCDTKEPMAHRLFNLRVPGSYLEAGDVHYIDASSRLAEFFGVERVTIDWRPELFIREDERSAAEAAWSAAPGEGPRLLVNLSAQGRGRRWPDERFVAVIEAARAAARDVAVGVIGVPAEEASVRAVASAAGAVAIATPTIRRALAAVATADAVLTPDTSISHAASALRKPAVVMLRQDALSYAPYRNAGAVLLWEGDDIAQLGVKEVTEPVVALLRQPAEASRAG